MSIRIGSSQVPHRECASSKRISSTLPQFKLGFCAFLLWRLLLPPFLIGQSAIVADQISAPIATGKVGQVDSSALDQVNKHLLAIGNVAWTGMQGTGQITYGGDKTSYPASLTILGERDFRLDAQTANGTQSIRINGRMGKMQSADGRVDSLSPATASTGLVQFPVLRTVDFRSQSISLTDQGSTSVDGLTLHRLRMESGAVAAKVGAPTPRTTVTDFYFDPKTNLLIKSANSIRLAGSGSDQIRVTTYEDYRQVNGSMIPFRFTQSLDGQVLWTLQLSDAQISTDKQTAYFEF